MHPNRKSTHEASYPSIVGLALAAMPLSGVHALGWASVSTPTLLGDRTFPVAGMSRDGLGVLSLSNGETGDHLSVANSKKKIYRPVEWMRLRREPTARTRGPALHTP